MSKIFINNSFISESQDVFNTQNRAFKYGDALFETMIAFTGYLPFLEEHYQRLTNNMRFLEMNIPNFFTQNYLNDKIKELLSLNRFYKAARVRVTVYRNSTGLYTPDNNEIDFVIETKDLKRDGYELNKTGLRPGLYQELLKPLNALSRLKSTNTLLYIKAGLYAKANSFDECFIHNENYNICECISSNVFFLQGTNVYTPPLSSACIPGIMRQTIIDLLIEYNYTLFETECTERMLFDADEVFLTNSISGIKWVAAYENKRYYYRTAKKLISLLNDRYTAI